MMLRDILKLVIVLLLFHFVGNIAVYNVFIQSRSLGQIRWWSDTLTIGLIVSILGTVWRHKRNNGGNP